MSLLSCLSLVSLVLTLAVSLEVGLGMRRLTRISRITPLRRTSTPRVSIIIPACNEAQTIGPALESVLGLDYPNFEVIVINDRSTDATAEVLAGFAERFSRLAVHHIAALPAGWLGKSHALHLGAGLATGDYLLFTDADIIMESSVLSRAMHYLLAHRLDHLCLFFENRTPGGLLNALMLELGGGLLLLFQPWLAKEPANGRFMGVGAFNMVRMTAYREIGGHRPVAMHPIDDIMLGKVLKMKGFRQECLLGEGLVAVKWYPSIAGLIDGLMKNAFALFDYRLSRVLAGVGLAMLIAIVPVWGLLLASGWARLLFGIAVLARLGSFAVGFVQIGLGPANALWSLLTSYLSIFIVIKAAFTTLGNHGITWRGTHYSLDELRANLF